MPWRHIAKKEVRLQSFLTLALGGGELSASCHGRFAAGKEPQNPLNRWLHGPHKQSRRFWEEITHTCCASDPRCPAYSIVTVLYWLSCLSSSIYKIHWPKSVVPVIPTCRFLAAAVIVFFFYFREINGMTVCFKCGPSVAPVNKPIATQPSQLLYRYDCPLSVIFSNVGV